MNTDSDLNQLLKKYFGFNSFRDNQLHIIKSIISENNNLVIMPTGGGKSLCYQMSALYLDGMAIIISPLIALMKNQVDILKGIFGSDLIACVLNSSLNSTELERVRYGIESGITKLLYIAPESLSKESNINLFKRYKISFVAVDEAHCISEWGHDFRPEYRNIFSNIQKIDKNVKFTALTATATPKVQDDIIKNLHLDNCSKFKSSFNRPNLFYEIRKKDESIDKQIISFIKSNANKSGIVYCLSRKKVEDFTNLLQINGIKALPYHAGLDQKVRSKNQEFFLMDDCDVIVATIAFGMGIDKPDIRFVIHYNIPKSLESYYQETGRAGRDGGEGHCLAFYNYDDIEKLEKFLSGKPISEQEQGLSLLEEVASFCETSMSRRKFILNYFGEEFDELNAEGSKMDDNSKNPKEQIDVINEFKQVIDVIEITKEKYKLKELSSYLAGIETPILRAHNARENKAFGSGKNDVFFWKSLIRKMVVDGFLFKKIEEYGVLKISDITKQSINSLKNFTLSLDHNYEKSNVIIKKSESSSSVIDNKLLNLLISLRKTISKKNNIPPFAIFQDVSINEMTFKYPTNIEELSKITGVGEVKAKKFGIEFINLIEKHITENDIPKSFDLVIKSSGVNSSLKLFFIQSVDKKLSIDEMAEAKRVEFDQVLKDLETIIYSGTKLDLKYIIYDLFDNESQEELFEFFNNLEDDNLSEIINEFEDEYEEEDLKIFRLYHYCKTAF
ncbi:MAG: ATP-dependent DNA helicase RecQ [Flavobacteriaceae bacterium]|nr:ATP-dependent DNA helicase RecQ [Flavobacteriaceae bacterium]